MHRSDNNNILMIAVYSVAWEPNVGYNLQPRTPINNKLQPSASRCLNDRKYNPVLIAYLLLIGAIHATGFIGSGKKCDTIK